MNSGVSKKYHGGTWVYHGGTKLRPDGFFHCIPLIVTARLWVPFTGTMGAPSNSQVGFSMGALSLLGSRIA